MTVLRFIVLSALAVVGTVALTKLLSVAGMDDPYFTPTFIALMIVWSRRLGVDQLRSAPTSPVGPL